MLLLPLGLTYFSAEHKEESKFSLGHKYTTNNKLRIQEIVAHKVKKITQ